jgi:predicted transcriptional regulator
MEVVWREGEVSIRDVLESLDREARPGYTTVQTIFQRLESKGAVRRTRKIGNAFLYEPTLERGSAYRRIVDDVLSLFGGSARPLIAHLFDAGKLTLEDLRAIEDLTEGAKEDE